MLRRVFCKILLVAIVIFSILALPGVLFAQGSSADAFERVAEVQERHTETLMAKQGVVGTAVGRNDHGGHVVFVLLENPGVGSVPKELEGIPVRTVVTGKILALTETTNLNPGKFTRPVPIGVSVGNEGECSSGTIGCRVTDGTNVYALSNNHVLARENIAPIGSEVLQPGLFDSDPQCFVNLDDSIGILDDFVRIKFNFRARNEIDAAIALSDTLFLGNATPSDGYGTPKSETVPAFVGLNVQKYGRTTYLTTGTVTATNAIVTVGYGAGVARFVNQIIVEDESAVILPGDSGSLLVVDGGDDDCKAVGLLFAGNEEGTFAVANPIDAVLNAFGVTIDSTTAGEPPVLTSIEVSPISATIEEGQTKQFTATGSFDDDSTADLTSTATWVSSNTDAATVNASGLATGIADGTTNITVTQDGVTSNIASLEVTASSPPPTLESISVTPTSATIEEGQTQQFTATGSYDNDSTADLTSTVTWASSITAVAVVDASGLATGIEAGTTNITATQNGVTSNAAALEVTPATTTDAVTVTKAEYKLRNGELNVEATSTGSPYAVLTVYGRYDNYTESYGQMTYDSRKDIYKLKKRGVTDPDKFVMVISILGGSDTKTVKYK